MSKIAFALQLYSVRDHMEKDIAGTLREVKNAGYEFVELAGTYGATPSEFKKLLRDAGVKVMGAHLPYSDVVDDVNGAIAFAGLFEIKYLVVPSLDRTLTETVQGWQACGKRLNQAGAALHQAGIKLCYHNHAAEFQLLDNRYPMDVLLAETEPVNLALELDTFWIRYVGLNPVSVIDKYQGRCPLLHVKDMMARSRAFTEVGRGIMPWTEIFEKALACGTKWFIVEQDSCGRDSLDSARMSAFFMREQ